MTLTDAKVRGLKARSAPYKLSDGQGLYVFVSPTGSKLWRLSYRYFGKQKTVALGKYPELSLLNARKARDDQKRLLANSVDPSAAKKVAKRERTIATSNTFEAVADEWFAQHRDTWVESYSSRLMGRLKGDLIPDLGKRPIADIQPLELLDVIRKIEKRGALEMAKRVLQMASGIFRYGVATGKCQRDPTFDLRGALKPAGIPKHRAALPAIQLPIFMAALENYDGNRITKLALKLMILTFVRTSELRFARWNEFENLEGEEPLWRIPAVRMKMRRDHLVPLSPQAVEIIASVRRLTGKGEYLFPANTKSGVMSENTLLFAIYRMGYHSRATIHGFRTTASTILNEKGFNRDWVEMQLAHVDGSVRGIYNAAEWLSGRREMLGWWACHIEPKDKIRLVVSR